MQKAADFVVSHGPSFGSERWEEQGGHSPSTIAAEIAGLVAAGRIADVNGDHAAARVYRATADHFQRSIKGWTVTTTGPYGTGRYFIRLSKNGDPDEAVTYGLGNGGPTADQRAVVDAGFLELTRLGILPATDPDVRRSLPVVDATIRRDTPSGPGFYRYGTATDPTTEAGTEDGYGDCYEPDATECSPSGKPWPTGGNGSGHLWPVLNGERAEQLLQTGDRGAASRLLLGMQRFSSGIGLVPEQAWENPDLAASPYGTDPAVASIGFVDGGPAGSASPLTWAQAQQVRLTQSLGGSRPVEQPAIVRQRYQPRPPAVAAVDVTAPADGAQVTTATVEVAGTASPGATVDIASTATDTGGDTSVVTVRAGADGAFAATVPSPFGTSVITVAVTTRAGATGYARRTVVSDFITGTTVLDVTDPSGDDNGPGTFAYPTSADFHPGAFDIERFQVIVSGDDAVLRVRTRDLSPTFGSPLGAQLLDVFVHTPDATTTSTAAAVREPQLHHRRVVRLEPSDRGAGLRQPGVRGRRRPVAGPGVGAGQPDLALHHDVRAAGRARNAGPRLVVRRGAARPGRVQPRPGPRVPAPAGALPVRPVRVGRRGQPDLQLRPGRGAEGDGRDHAGRRRPVRRARPDPRAGADRRGSGALSVAVWSPTAMNCTDFVRFVTNRGAAEGVGRPLRCPAQPGRILTLAGGRVCGGSGCCRLVPNRNELHRFGAVRDQSLACGEHRSAPQRTARSVAPGLSRPARSDAPPAQTPRPLRRPRAAQTPRALSRPTPQAPTRRWRERHRRTGSTSVA